MMAGRVTSAMTRSRPPQSGQIDRSIAKHPPGSFHPGHRRSLCIAVVVTGSTRRLHPSVCSRALSGRSQAVPCARPATSDFNCMRFP